MRLLLLLCFMVGIVCFAAKDALDIKLDRLAKEKQLALNSLNNHNGNTALL